MADQMCGNKKKEEKRSEEEAFHKVQQQELT